MNDHRAKSMPTAFLLLLALVGTIALHVYFQPPTPGLEARSNRFRANLAYFYMASKASESSDGERWLKEQHAEVLGFKQPGIDDGKLEPVYVEAVAILFCVEGKNEDVQAILERWSYLPNAPALRYALGQTDILPDQWQSQLSDDLFDQHLRVLVHERAGDASAKAAAVFQLRQQESKVSQNLNFIAFAFIFKLLGMGFMMSIYISSRQFKRLGRKFFALSPLFIPSSVLFRFVAAYLPAHILTEYLLKSLMPGQDFWARLVIATLIQVGIAWYLLRTLVFNGPKQDIFRSLGMHNLTMRFGNLFQIVGALAILHACRMFAGELAIITPWQLDRLDPNDSLATLANNPVGGALYLLVGCVLLAAAHEVIFRGLIFRALLAHVKPWQALVLSAAVYALLAPIAVWPIAFGVGFGFSLIYYRTANLLVSIWAHALWNCSALLMVLMGIVL